METKAQFKNMVWKSANSYVVTIPINEYRALKLKEGSLVKVEMEKI